MKTLICIDGHDLSLKAAMLAAKLVCTTNSETTFLYVRRYRRDTRGYNIQRKATEIFANWKDELPEMQYLHEAESVFMKHCGYKANDTELGDLHRALVHVGDGVFEEGTVRLRSSRSTHLKIREGVPHEEILKEAEEGHYDIVILGARHVAGCHWYEIEHIPLSVVKKAPCPVAVIGREFEEGQPMLLYVGKQDLPGSTLYFGRALAKKLKSEIEVLAVLRTYEPTFQFSKKVSSMIDEWSEDSLRVNSKVLTGEPDKVILKMAPDYGLIICSYGEKRIRNRLSKVTKKVLCNKFNVLVLR